MIIIGEQKEIPEPSHWPVPMSRYGRNPYGSPKYRIVFAPSVKTLVGGRFADGFVGYRPRPAYRQIGNEWIVEKWMSAKDSTKMTQEQYEKQYKDMETGLILTGPYPDRGRYELCEVLNGTPAQINIDTVIALLEKAEKNDKTQNRIAIEDNLKREQAETDRQNMDMLRDKRPAFGIRAANIGGMVKKTKTAPKMKWAHEVKHLLPTTKRGAQVISNPTR